jgi:hypothetical protein
MKTEDFIDRKITALWNKKVTNASEAHFRAEEITRFEKIKDNMKRKSNN